MKIDSSNVLLTASSSSKISRKEQYANYTLFGDKDITLKKGLENLKNGKDLKQAMEKAEKDTEKDDRKRLINSFKIQAPVKISKSETKAEKTSRDYRLELLERMMQLLMNRRFKIHDLEDTQAQESVETPTTAASQESVAEPAITNVVRFAEVSYSNVETFAMQSMSFSASAQIKTSDGKVIDLNLELNMSSAFYSKVETLGIVQGTRVLCDPLVMNINASSAGLSNEKMTFDLDCDGTEDQVSTLLGGSGFLALDKNGDGKVNDGNELFGAKSGDGFKDLSVYDEDKNGWIDENDDVFNKLRIWFTEGDGESKLIGLGQAGVGAIYLGNLNTDYALFGETDMNGMIRKTGIFVNEDGSAGTVQHVDLAL